MDDKLNTAPKNVWGSENKIIKSAPYVENNLKMQPQTILYVAPINVQKPIGNSYINLAYMMIQYKKCEWDFQKRLQKSARKNIGFPSTGLLNPHQGGSMNVTI